MNITSLKSKFQNSAKNKNAFATIAFAFFALVCALVPSLSAQAADLFADGRETVTDTFGADSTVLYILLILEVLAAIFAYVKTKNLAIFGGIAAIMIFTTIVFNMIS